jgi:3'-phosphoadenosine 5'-phosphosulfate sulfotransferase (PAPS reductase)/FAD synthetase
MATGMKRFISLSGGVESTTMCILYGSGAKGIWADTGAEHEEMYARIDLLEEAIARIHPGFEIIRVKGKTSAYKKVVDTLIDYIRAAKLLPSSGQRFCTDRFKIAPIERYLKHEGQCELMIGFNADEQPGDARKGNFMKLKNVGYRYPLYDDGFDRDDCEAILRQHGLHPEFPIYMRRGGCFMCFYKSAAEYKAMYFLDNATFMRAWQLEKDIQDARKKYYSLLSGKPLAVLASECEREKALWGLDEVLKMYESQPQGKTCGAFCNR